MSNSRHQEAARYTAAAQVSMTDLAEAVMLTPSPNTTSPRIDEDFFEKRNLTPAIYHTNIVQLVSILASTNHKILLAVIDGTLPNRASTDLRQAVERERDIPDEMQGIYVNYVVNQQNQHPTKSDTLDIIEYMEEYKEAYGKAYDQLSAQTQQLVTAIDTQYGKRYTKGQLVYCTTLDQKGQIASFVDGMRLRVSQEPHGPILGGISEIGFSNQISTRLEFHFKHVLSQFTMCLFDACGRVRFPARYSILGFPIMRIVNPLYADMAELAFSRLASSYLKWGWGFNGKTAGTSVGGVNKLPVLQATRTKKDNLPSWATIESNDDMHGIEQENERIEDRVHGMREEVADALEEETKALDREIAAMETLIQEMDRVVPPGERYSIMRDVEAEWGPAGKYDVYDS